MSGATRGRVGRPTRRRDHEAPAQSPRPFVGSAWQPITSRRIWTSARGEFTLGDARRSAEEPEGRPQVEWAPVDEEVMVASTDDS